MKYGDLLIIFDNIYGNQMNEEKKNKICKKIELYYKYISIDYDEIKDVFDDFIYFYDINVIDKISDSLFIYMFKILGFDKEKISILESLYFLDYLKYLIVPYSINHCDYEYNINKFLFEFDVFFSNILKNCDNILDYEMLRGINPEIYNLVNIRKKALYEFIRNNDIDNKTIKEKIIMEITLNHLTSIFYFGMDNYNKDYEIISNAYDNILNNSEYLVKYVEEKKLYNDILSFNLFGDMNIEKEYIFCKDLLDKMYNEKNEIKRKVK